MEGKTKIVLMGITIFLIPYILYRIISLPYSIIDQMGSFYILYLIAVLILLFFVSLFLFYYLKKNHSPYWLLGVSIGVMLLILFLSVPILLELPACREIRLSADPSGMCGLFTAISFSISLFFIPIGVVIGFVIGKIKSKKKKSNSPVV